MELIKNKTINLLSSVIKISSIAEHLINSATCS